MLKLDGACGLIPLPSPPINSSLTLLNISTVQAFPYLRFGFWASTSPNYHLGSSTVYPVAWISPTAGALHWTCLVSTLPFWSVLYGTLQAAASSKSPLKLTWALEIKQLESRHSGSTLLSKSLQHGLLLSSIEASAWVNSEQRLHKCT